MKKILFFLLSFTTIHLQAQDVIVKKDGSTILSKVLEVNAADIKYKKFSNQNGPTYTINISEILSVNYENGDKDDFSTSQPSPSNDITSTSPRLVEKQTDARNAELIASYNQDCHSTGKWQNDEKPAKCGYLIYWVSPTSTMSNDEIEMSFVKQRWEDDYYNDYYAIVLKNKTNNFIYIDLANSFRNCSTGEVRCYYDAEQTTVSKGGSSGGSIGLGAVAGALGVGGTLGQLAGGVAVGGGTSGAVSTTYTSQRIISIPPNGQRNLTDFKRVKVKGRTYQTVSEAEDFDEIKTGIKGNVKAGSVSYDESNTPFTMDYTITYSTSDTFFTYSIIHSKLYLKEVVGSKYSAEHIKQAGWVLNRIDKYVSGVTDNTLVGIQTEF